MGLSLPAKEKECNRKVCTLFHPLLKGLFSTQALYGHPLYPEYMDGGPTRTRTWDRPVMSR